MTAASSLRTRDRALLRRGVAVITLVCAAAWLDRGLRPNPASADRWKRQGAATVDVHVTEWR